MSAAVDTTVRTIPYAGVSNPMPRTTAWERAVYQAWETQARAELALYEPEHAAKERLTHYEDDGSWRSLPDYDGPPMRAPSGFVVRFPAIEAVEPFDQRERDELHRRLRSLGAQKKRARRVEAADAVRAFGMAGALCFEPPLRGRGWCPGLAGVGK